MPQTGSTIDADSATVPVVEFMVKFLADWIGVDWLRLGYGAAQALPPLTPHLLFVAHLKHCYRVDKAGCQLGPTSWPQSQLAGAACSRSIIIFIIVCIISMRLVII